MSRFFFSRNCLLFFCFSFLLLFISSCFSSPSRPSLPRSSINISSPSDGVCSDFVGTHTTFSVFVDGANVGREVRTEFLENGASSTDRMTISHLIKNQKIGHVLFQTTHVRTERTDSTSGALISTTFTKKDQVNITFISISAGSTGFDRVISSPSLYSSPTAEGHTGGPPGDQVSSVAEKKDVISLSGDEVIGFRLGDLLRRCAQGALETPRNVNFFSVELNNPLSLEILAPTVSTLTLDGQDIAGSWISVRKEKSPQIIARSFFDQKGNLLLEDYPELHETRQRVSDSLFLPSETSELIVGLRSKTYIYDPSTATRAIYQLSATPDRLEALSLLEEPLNQSLQKLSDDKLVLDVRAGAPDLNEPPVPADLSSSTYIQPDNPAIIGALRYLRSSGKHGQLSYRRQLNATPVIARASLIENPKAFWADPNKVAGIVMRYVGALLPDKRHNFSMSDAVTTLDRGGGDCTEHAVLFSSLMRAHGIPTRLVVGIFLTPGGMWAYHMWNAYWDGDMWQSIDPSTMMYRTGALHVALGRGASVFADVRERLADFMWRTLSGVSFDLVEASNNGEMLFLARPNGLDQDLAETSLFNAVVLSDRGDYNRALELLDENIPKTSRSLAVNFMRIELLVDSEQYDLALNEISSLRNITSASYNTAHLDNLELKCLISSGRVGESEALYHRIHKRLKDDPIDTAILEAEYSFALGRESYAISLLQNQLATHADNLSLLSHFSTLVSKLNTDLLIPSLLANALTFSWKSAYLSRYVDHDILATLSRLLFQSRFFKLSEWMLDHALILAPKDPSLHSLRETISSNRNCSSKEISM